MLKPSFRFFIIPLGAICTLASLSVASLSTQHSGPSARRDAASMLVHQQVIDCSDRNPAEVCVIASEREPIAH